MLQVKTVSNQIQKPVQVASENSGLALLLDRISKSEGAVSPNDRAVARIYAGYMRSASSNQSRNRRKTDATR